MDEARPTGLARTVLGSKSCFGQPAKRINDSADVKFFLTSKAYTDILTFILQLNTSLFPRTNLDHENREAISWPLGSNTVASTPATRQLATLLVALGDCIAEAPPDQGPRRFGNVAFRKWYNIVEAKADILLDECLPSLGGDPELSAKPELKAYLLGSFGSAQRLDYGTGHELSFLAFLAALWKLGGFDSSDDDAEQEQEQERALVLHVFEPYLELMRRLILTYTLEPAGSHGVWGLDDHFFLPYLFGSAQLGPAVSQIADVPSEGSLAGAPDPGDVVKATAVDRERKTNMYFSAIGFIYDVKKGPFWEHSPYLFDISGIRAGWAKINKGMIKMYIAEVLSKFPVVQHFPFGELFPWEHDPRAPLPATTPHTSVVQDHPSHTATLPSSARNTSLATTVPATGSTTAPWAANPNIGSAAPSGMPSTRAPWAGKPSSTNSTTNAPMPATKAPWAKDR